MLYERIDLKMEAVTEETFIETTVPAIVSEAENVMEAVSEGTIDSTVLKSFYNALVDYLPTVITAIVIYIAGKIIAKILLHIIDKAMGRTRIDETAQGFLRSLISITFTAFVIVITLSTLGIPMTSIVTTIGAAGVAVALAEGLDLGILVLIEEVDLGGGVVTVEQVGAHRGGVNVALGNVLAVLKRHVRGGHEVGIVLKRELVGPIGGVNHAVLVVLEGSVSNNFLGLAIIGCLLLLA